MNTTYIPTRTTLLSNTQQRTESQFRDYLHTNLLQGISDEDMARLATLYTQNVTQGSPFDTGLLNAYTPQFKRLAALQGDLLFQAPRRHFQQHRSGKQNMWTFCSLEFFSPPPLLPICTDLKLVSKRLKTQPLLGAVSQRNGPHLDPILTWTFFLGTHI